jgi:hypothetical protein
LNIVEDSEGMVFSTPKGQLRLLLSAKDSQAVWIQGRKKVQLTTVPIRANRELIYSSLGVYDEERFGTPCEHY